MIIPTAVSRWLKPLADKAERRRLKIYAVGGCVRDWLLGRDCVDLDISVEGDSRLLADTCARLVGAKPRSFDQFGTLRVVGKRFRIDLAACRREGYPAPASLPRVSPAGLTEDLFRRDFTINAMALPLGRPSPDLIDPYGGEKDLKDKVLRVIHDQSFRDDPTRVFRAARFLCRFGFKPAADFEGLVSAALSSGHAALLSRHRLAQELLRVLSEEAPACALRRLRQWGYLSLLHPGMREMKFSGVEDSVLRLGVLLVSQEALGESFLDSLPLERSLAAPLREALRTARDQASPRAALSASALKILKECFPKLPAGALKRSFLKGGDLLARGIRPGVIFSKLLSQAARAQWRGGLRSRREALLWLKGHIRNKTLFVDEKSR